MEQNGPALWGIVLAGGEGERLRAFVQASFGTDTPKQFCTFCGRRTMVERTLMRTQRVIPRERLLLSATAHHRLHVLGSMARHPPGTVLFQPLNRDTAPGILLPLVHVLHRDPEAVVVVLPSDHFVLPGRRFMASVVEAADYLIESGDDSLILLGVAPAEAETDYGWIKPGFSANEHEDSSIRPISRFIEKPPQELARALMENGWLWNTMVMVVRAQALWERVRELAPELAAYFSMFRRTIGTPWEHRVLDEVYCMIPSVNFSTAILSQRPDRLLVLPVRNVYWSDWGRDERVLETLGRFKLVLCGQRTPAATMH
jgi:mannose-1-phosphate guanylyltransferase